MQSIEPKIGAPIVLFLLSVTLCICAARGIRPDAVRDSRKSAELTRVDLFSTPGWQQMAVSVDGFSLGMTREEANQSARAHGFVLLPVRTDQIPPPQVSWEPNRACCGPLEAVQAHGPYRNQRGNYVGVRLYFSRTQRLEAIS